MDTKKYIGAGGHHLVLEFARRTEGPASGGLAGWTLVSAGYFETFKIPVLRGRTFAERDEGPPVVIINQALAKRFWRNGDPLKDQIIFRGDETRRQIIGVVGDVHDDFLNRDPRPTCTSLRSLGPAYWLG